MSSIFPGNHDEFLRDYALTPLELGGIKVQDELIHETADGRKLLVIHGDFFDGVVRHARWLAVLGDWAYSFMLWLNVHLQLDPPPSGLRLLVALGLSESQSQKLRWNSSGNMRTFWPRRHAAGMSDGIVCGHIHTPEMRMIDGILYCNDGDW